VLLQSERVEQREAQLSSPEGFAQFVSARQRALQRSAWLLTGDWALAEDLVQTALVRSWPRWEKIWRRDDPEIYVRRVMVNTWIRWNRLRWRQEQAIDSVPDGQAPGDLAGDVVLRMTVRAALGSLTARQRAVLVLRVFDSPTTTATGCPTCRSPW
jgi:RNA polymerase sigma factor (sigma-70 family)